VWGKAALRSFGLQARVALAQRRPKPYVYGKPTISDPP
jgi:hypothetical protein